MSGIFYGVGVGPGDSELITVKGVKILQEADIIIAPQTKKEGPSTALNIVRPYLDAKAQVVKLVFPMVDIPEELNESWRLNKEKIDTYLQEGKKVAFITLGDPMLYSTYIYVQRLIKDSGYQVVTVPGITSFSLMAGRLGEALAENDETLVIVPATAGEETLAKALSFADNVVLMKVSRNFRGLVNRLKEQDLLKGAFMVSHCGWENERIYTNLEELAEDTVSYFSTILVKRNK